MNKKILITLGILVVIIALLGVYVIRVYKPTLTKEQLGERFSEFRAQYQEKKAQGYNVAEAEELVRKAKQAFDRKDYKMANKFLDDAFTTLARAEIIVIPETVKEEVKEKLSQVKVAVLYQKITDGIYLDEPYRTVDDVINLLKETNADFVFRAWWRWSPCPESPEIAPSPAYYKNGYTYQQFRETLMKIERKLPEVIFCGGVVAQRITFEERNPITGKIYGKDETWDMALDPSKWGIHKISKEQLQTYLQEHHTGETGYYPDITNPEFQELLLSCAKKQIDCGMDAIWIDMLFSQARILEEITGNPEHPAVKESFEAASKIVDEIHKYGHSKRKYIYVGTFWNFVELPYSPPDVDFVTVIPSKDEVFSMDLDEEKWDSRVEKIRAKLGDIPIFALIDWSLTTNTSLGVFSQKLSKDEQREFLRIADEFFQEKGIIFIYPLHGGFMGKDAKILSFGKSKTYDSLAPEFQTYEIIKELAQNKTKP